MLKNNPKVLFIFKPIVFHLKQNSKFSYEKLPNPNPTRNYQNSMGN